MLPSMMVTNGQMYRVSRQSYLSDGKGDNEVGAEGYMSQISPFFRQMRSVESQEGRMEMRPTMHW